MRFCFIILNICEAFVDSGQHIYIFGTLHLLVHYIHFFLVVKGGHTFTDAQFDTLQDLLGQ